MLGLVLALAMLLAVALLTFITSRQYSQWATQARQNHATLLSLRELLVNAQNAASSERGFLLTGNAQFLAQEESETRNVRDLLTRWDESSLGDATYTSEKERFKKALNKRLALSNAVIALRSSGRLSQESLVAMTEAERQPMLDVAKFERQLEVRQEDALRFRSSRARDQAQFSELIAIFGCFGVFALLLRSTVRIHSLISTRSRLSAELAKSEMEFRRLADALPQMVWRATCSGALEYTNAGWREFARNPDSGAPRGFQELLHPEDRDPFLQKWERSLNSALPLVCECRMRDPSGKYRWFLFRTTLAQDADSGYSRQLGDSGYSRDSGYSCWYCTFTEIDEQKNIERALHRANEELRQFAYAAAHDLQEPLRNVASLLGLLRRTYRHELSPSASEWVDETVNNAKRMHNMVKDLLAYTRALDVSDPVFQADSNDSISVAMAKLTALIAETGATIECGALPRIGVLPGHLVQLFENILSNGIKFRKTGEPPVIRIATEFREDEWLFSISDNGIGFDPMYAERIFGVFKRLHTHGEYPGTGMGLAICFRIVTHYGGRIWAVSRPGQGATFHFTLPAAQERALVATGH